MTAAFVIGKLPLHYSVTVVSHGHGGTPAGRLGVLPFGFGHAVADDDGRRQDDGGNYEARHGEGHGPARETGGEGDDEGDGGDGDGGVTDPLAAVGEASGLGAPLPNRVVHRAQSKSGA